MAGAPSVMRFSRTKWGYVRFIVNCLRTNVPSAASRFFLENRRDFLLIALDQIDLFFVPQPEDERACHLDALARCENRRARWWDFFKWERPQARARPSSFES